MFLAECHLLHMIMLLLHSLKKKAHLFVSPSRQITLNSALQRAFKAFQQCLLDNQGINSNLIHRRNNAVTVDDEVKVKKKPIQQTNRLHIKHLYFRRRTENHDLELFLDPSHLPDLSFRQNTAICRSCVQIQSHELRLSLHFPRLHDKALSP